VFPVAKHPFALKKLLTERRKTKMIDLKLIQEIISFVSEAQEFLKTAGKSGEKLYKQAARILKKLGGVI
jgi:hypothetical protein